MFTVRLTSPTLGIGVIRTGDGEIAALLSYAMPRDAMKRKLEAQERLCRAKLDSRTAQESRGGRVKTSEGIGLATGGGPALFC